mmetsp:Transcript_13349/g.22188  ORF Transcript_13349/g.22188 Transcript_13349/m.22188 type:complete len:271 (+) Transcript_13349:789-1601(+)
MQLFGLSQRGTLVRSISSLLDELLYLQGPPSLLLINGLDLILDGLSKGHWYAYPIRRTLIKCVGNGCIASKDVSGHVGRKCRDFSVLGTNTRVNAPLIHSGYIFWPVYVAYDFGNVLFMLVLVEGTVSVAFKLFAGKNMHVVNSIFSAGQKIDECPFAPRAINKGVEGKLNGLFLNLLSITLRAEYDRIRINRASSRNGNHVRKRLERGLDEPLLHERRRSLGTCVAIYLDANLQRNCSNIILNVIEDGGILFTPREHIVEQLNWCSESG